MVIGKPMTLITKCYWSIRSDEHKRATPKEWQIPGSNAGVSRLDAEPDGGQQGQVGASHNTN